MMRSVFLLHLALQLCLVTMSAANPAEPDLVGSLVLVDSPEVRLVPPLPPAVTVPPYEVDLANGGGFIVKVKDMPYRIESSYSYPHGGENQLLAGASDEEGEDAWQVKTRELDNSNYLVTAKGKYYSITRLIEMKPTCVVVKDTIRNISDDIVGIITSKSGIYGWHGDPALHIVYLYDERGILNQSSFLTTVDDTCVRTDLRLKKEQSAALVKLPITLAASSPVNVNVREYDANGIPMALNGQGEVKICVKTGDFTVESGVSYRVTSDRVQRVVATESGELSMMFMFDGYMMLQIERVQ